MILASFRMFIRQIFSDSMLAAACAAPFLAGTTFRFGIPALEKLIEKYIGIPDSITPYYLLVNLFLGILAPFMLCFASSMVILEERDQGVGPYMMVTPVGKFGYIISRLLIPAGISAGVSVLVLLLFGISGLSFPLLLCVAFGMSLISVLLSLLITSFSRNRVEGMAIAKLSGIIFSGLAVPFFVKPPYTYLAAPLPTYWIAEFTLRPSFFSFLAFIGVCLLSISILFPIFQKKGIGG